MYSLFVLAAFFAAGAVSAPTSTVKGTYDFTPNLAEFYSKVDEHISEARRQADFPTPPICDLSQASMPVAPTPLPSPDAGTALLHVAVGRGTQNYTCANNAPTTTPVAIGAVASLYNVSCVAALYPDILTLLPDLALQYPLPADPSSTLAPANLDLSGHHIFLDTTTPFFNLDVDPATQFGQAVAKKNGTSNAPAGSPLGPDNVGDGSVAWLYLKTINGTSTVATTNNIKNVYRTNTAGGSPPTDCSNSTAVFDVQYSALYWFWSIPS